MRGRLFAAFALVLTIVLTGIGPAFAAVGSDPNPAAAEWMVSDYAVTLTGAAQLSLSATLAVHKARVEGSTFSAREMRDTHNSGSNFAAKVEAAVRESARETLEASFPGSVVDVSPVKMDLPSLQAAGSASAYEPAPRLTFTATVALDRGSQGLSSFKDEALDAALAAGAAYKIDLNLKADPGHNVTYTIGAANGRAFSEVTSGTLEGGKGRFVISNWKGASAATTAASLKLVDPAAPRYTAEDVRNIVTLAIPTFQLDENDRLGLSVSVVTEIRVLALADDFKDALPARVTLPFASADGIRALHAAGAISDVMLADAEAKLRTAVASSLDAVLSERTAILGGFDRATIERAAASPHKAEPPLVFKATVNGSRAVPGATSDDIRSALDIGATLTFELDLAAAARRNMSYVVQVPTIRAVSSPDGVPGATANEVRFTLANAAGASPLSRTVKLNVRDATAQPADHAEAALDVVVDLKDLDVTLAGAAANDFGNLHIDVKVRGDLASIEVPASLRSALPSGVRIDYLSADSIRRLLERGAIAQSDIDAVEKALLDNMTKKLGAALGGNVAVAGGFDRSTLAAGSKDPISFKAQASLVKPLSGAGAASGQAIALYTTKQSFDLPKIEGLDTTYTVILPPGLAVAGGDAQGGSFEATKVDGRDAFRVKPSGDSAKTTVSMAVTPSFVVVKFWYVVLAIVLLLALVFGTPLALAIRNSRRKKAQ
ncbi:MAG TPA: hypothetical protein VM889_13715 [Candidatus Thermoplasmatota archaeon]|nr:hypothetical protein [Candidatus Thermoplasmatota archaeon]